MAICWLILGYFILTINGVNIKLYDLTSIQKLESDAFCNKSLDSKVWFEILSFKRFSVEKLQTR